jgi:hypothetical protein
LKFFRWRGEVKTLAFGEQEGSHTDNAALGIQNRGSTGALGDGRADLQDLPFLAGEFPPGGDNALGEGTFQAEGAADDGDAGAGFRGTGRGQGEAGKVLGLQLEEGKVVGGVGSDDAQNGEKAAVFGLGEDLFRAGDDVVVGDEQAIRGDQETRAGSFHLPVVVLNGEEVDRRPGLLGEGTEVGNLSGGEHNRG